jgi:nucleoside-diphosphate-sugar epimerase
MLVFLYNKFKIYAIELLFFQNNLQLTKNLLTALPKTCKHFVLISTVAVYGKETGTDIQEDAPLAGATPYALSKIQTEQAVLTYCNQHNIPCLILRLPLVVGKNAPGNLGKMQKAIQRGRYVRIGAANAQKSMVLATDVANLLANCWDKSGIYTLTDGQHPTFFQLEELLADQCKKPIMIRLPLWLARLLAQLGDLTKGKFPFTTATYQKITQPLVFDDSKARNELGWQPHAVIENPELW